MPWARKGGGEADEGLRASDTQPVLVFGSRRHGVSLELCLSRGGPPGAAASRLDDRRNVLVVLSRSPQDCKTDPTG
jgi:hypothetical protein